MVNLHIPLCDFWDYTPIEIDNALKIYTENKIDEIKLSWEQTRIQIYFTYLLTPSKRRKASYETFKKDYISLGFDKKESTTEIIDDEQFASINNFFK